MVKTEEHKCIVCGKPFMFEAEYCCDGNMCGCMGMPIYPPICSDACYEKAGWTLAKNTEQQVQPDNGGLCTRPDVFDCHAKVGTGGRCMNIVPCPPLQVN